MNASQPAAAVTRVKRGVAVVLALVAVSIATLLGLSLASSSDANLATSANLAKVASARAAAASGIDLARSMLASPEALESLHGATLFENAVVNANSVRVEVLDAETGGPATTESAAIEIVARSESDGVVQVARALGRANGHRAPTRADLDCSEFALLGKSSVTIEADALVGSWSKAPLAALGEPVKFGTAAGTDAGVHISSDASTHGCVRLRQASFATDREDAEEALALHVTSIPAPIQVPDAALPDEPDGHIGAALLMIDGLVAADAATTGDARIPARGSAVVRGAVRLDIGGNLFIERGAKVYVEGALVLVTRGNAVLDSCAIEVAPTGSLTMITNGDFTLQSAYVGGVRTDPNEGCDPTGSAGYDGGTKRTVLFGASDRRVLVADGSVVKGQVYAPKSRIDIETRSAVYGRLLGNEVYLRAGTALFYDPSLDERFGWSNPTSGIWTASGEVQPAVREVTKLDDDSLLEFSAKTGVEPEPTSVAEATLILSGEGALAADFNSRVEQLSDARERTLRRALKARLEERVEEIKRRKSAKLFDPEDASGKPFVLLGYESSVGKQSQDD